MITKQNLIYEGKAKQIYETTDNSKIIMYYKDSATAFNGEKKSELLNKGILNNKISTLIYKYLNKNGIKTHWLETINDREQLCEKVTIFPLEVIVRNRSAGNFSKRYGIEEGKIFQKAVFECSYKNDDLNDPLLNSSHILALSLATEEQYLEIRKQALLINDLLKNLFSKANLILVDFKIEFGLTQNNEIVLADEISPDSTRLWDMDSLEKLDKDRFRQDLGDVIKSYEEVLNRLQKVFSIKGAKNETVE